MISALLYLQFTSSKNRWIRQFKRLKQPKYLFGALFGALYFYFYFFRYLFQMPRGRPGGSESSPENLMLWESVGALALCVIVLLAWIIPHQRAALTFTEAEIAFLFPAPVKRIGLIHFKLVRSQLRIFFTIFILTLISNRFGGNAWVHAAGWWMIFSTLNLHLLGSSFVRTMLLDRGISNWRRRLIVLGVVGVAGAVVIFRINKALPHLDLSRLSNLDDFLDYVRQVLVSGPLPYLLYPFRLVVSPFFSHDVTSFARAMGPAALLLVLHYIWVIRCNVRFEEASVEASQKLATRIAEMRSGNWRGGLGKATKRRAPFKLGCTGFAPVAILWKNLISAGQMFSPRFWIMIAAVTVMFLIASATVWRGSGFLSIVAMVCGMFLPWSLLIGPQIMRQDLRQDLAQADVLKSFPMPGWQVVLGELLAPAAILTGLQWLLVIFASRLLGQIPHLTIGFSISILFSVMILLPVLNLVLLLIPNAGVLLFPGWFKIGKDGPQGIEATGQRLITMLAQLVAFLLALIPAAIGFAIVFLVVQLVVPPAVAMLPAAVTAAIILAAEVFGGVLVMGRVFERIDLSGELAA